jgi:hypothetical protein
MSDVIPVFENTHFIEIGGDPSKISLERAARQILVAAEV